MTSAHDADIVRRIANLIRRYTFDHPEAADTIVGVQRWWLPPLHEESAARVEAAVAQLVAEGILRSVALEDGRVVYSNAQRRP